MGLNTVDVHDFSVNLNYLGAPEIIKDRWPDLFQTIEIYPSLEGAGVLRYYREKFGISNRNFLAGNGSTELIYLVPRVLRFKKVLVITPSYHDYERASLAAGAKVQRYPLLPEDNFLLSDIGPLIDAVANADGIWLGRPNNPTGTFIPKELLLEIAAQFPDKWFIVDEAFIQFHDRWKEESFFFEKPLPNILVIQSLTKFYCLPGLRLGGIMGHEDVISRLKKAKEPWTINGIADSVAPLLLECEDYERTTRTTIRHERERFFTSLERMDGIAPFVSSADFLLCQWTKTGNLDDLTRHLLINGVYVRDCRNFSGLEENFFRVGLRMPEENDHLISLLSSFPD